MDRRFAVGGNKHYKAKRLWDRHREIARQIVLGGTNVEIADSLGCTPQTISNVRNSPIGQAEIMRMHTERNASVADMSTRLRDFAPIAEQLLEDIISGAEPAPISVRARYASQHLGRVGYGEVRKVATMNGTLSPEDIAEIKQRALRNAERCGVVIEAEVQNV